MPFVYIVRCKDNSLYTGWTTDLERRIQEHNDGIGAKYTRGRGPMNLEYFEEFESKEEAAKREYEIKQLTKKQKEKIISDIEIAKLSK